MTAGAVLVSTLALLALIGALTAACKWEHRNEARTDLDSFIGDERQHGFWVPRNTSDVVNSLRFFENAKALTDAGFPETLGSAA